MGKNAKDINEEILGIRIRWFDKVGLFRVADRGTAKIILSTRLKDGRFLGHKLTIITKRSGVIDGKFFNFNDYLEPKIAKNEYFLILKDGLYEWSTKPVSVKAYRRAIFDYIAYF